MDASATRARGCYSRLVTVCRWTSENLGERNLPLTRRAWVACAVASAGLCLAGCGASARLDAVPSGAGAVSFLRIANARFDGDDGEALKQEIWQSLTREWPR